MLVHRRVTLSIEFAGTHLYTWVERGTVRVKCLAQDHNTMSPARARTRTARSRGEHTNHKATSKGSTENTVRWRSSFQRSRTREIYSTKIKPVITAMSVVVTLLLIYFVMINRSYENVIIHKTICRTVSSVRIVHDKAESCFMFSVPKTCTCFCYASRLLHTRPQNHVRNLFESHLQTL